MFFIKKTFLATKMLDNSSFPYCNKEWIKVKDTIRSIELITEIKTTILNVLKPEKNFYWYNNTNNIELLIRLRLVFSLLKEFNFSA